LIVDALGWRRVLSNGSVIQPPEAFLSRGLEVHPRGRASELELWLDPSYVSPGYSWSFPASDEVRVGVGSFDPRVHVKDPTLSLVSDVGRSPDGWQGNWIPHRLRPAVEDGVFFAGDSAGHCLPFTAEGIRTALYFGVACGRLLASVLDGSSTKDEALASYAAFSESHRRRFEMLWWCQRTLRHLHPVTYGLARFLGRPRIVEWSFRHYLGVAPPEFALPEPPAVARSRGADAERTAAGEGDEISRPIAVHGEFSGL
jgi:flavin-dependent dehydrogenase